ncbi:MAG: hypothetical protein P1P78_11375 [Methyloprofundus sp.]|nr:hypothetical protein [Methyloprofundus sp.]
MANVTDKNALIVLNEWSIINGHRPPIYNALTNSVSINGVDDTEIKAVLDAATTVSIAEASSRGAIRGIQLAYPKPQNATLEQSKSWALLIASKVIGQLRAQATFGASAVTLSGWVDKLTLAQKISEGTATADDIAIIQSEADMRGLGETAAELALKISAKAQILRVIRSKIDGFEDRIERELAAVTDVPSYDAIVDALVNDGAAIISQLGV